MVDHLKTKCIQMDIKLRYNYNKRKLLSAGIKNEQPIIRAHRIFRRSSVSLANAIVNYYTKKSATNKYYKSIIRYIEENSQVKDYKVFPPEDAMVELYTKKDTIAEDVVQMKEAQVKSIMRTDFMGNKSSLKPEDYINEESDDFVQLDIIIERQSPK